MPDFYSIRPIANAFNEFALALYRKLAETPGNLIFSPFSVTAALGMTSAGARGETAAQMHRTLGFTPQPEEAHRALGRIIAALNEESGEPFELNIANSIWSQSGAPLLSEFLDRIRNEYFGEVEAVDFIGDTEGARAAINRWVEAKTQERIRGLIGPEDLNATTRLVLANAVYFKGLWETPFLKEFTRPEPFFLEGGGIAEASLMRATLGTGYSRTKGAQVVDLGYRGGDLRMLILLPDAKDGLRELENQFTGKYLLTLTSNLGRGEVAVLLPRVRMEPETVDLGRTLWEVGMPLAFDSGRADFSGINGIPPGQDDSLYISAVLHKAMVEVNEKGTEAAAATAVLSVVTSSPPRAARPLPVFRADHPFLFAIRDRRSGAILFLGRVADPTRN